MTTTKGRTDGDAIASRMFAQVFQAYLECSDEVQEAIRDMVRIVNAPDATDDEREAAVVTIADALFPSRHKDGELGADLEECENQAITLEIKTALRELNREEATFADRLSKLMDLRIMTQGDVAKAIGVQQSAISMMLSRHCRPQRRTVEKIAEAFKVSPEELWPGFKGD